jgi:hypothetical protein
VIVTLGLPLAGVKFLRCFILVQEKEPQPTGERPCDLFHSLPLQLLQSR